MSLIQIIILSFVQGLTEFLPISSSGHLLILPHIFGWQDQGLEMDVAVHIGTLAAVLCYFWRDIGSMIASFWRYLGSGLQGRYFDQHVRLAFILVGATIPAVIAGFLLKKVGIDLVRHVVIVGFTSIGFGILLYLADRAEFRYTAIERMTYGRGLMVGFAQALALIPGTSRSGACMTAGRFLGFDRVTAARFAFLLSIPSILGAGVLTTIDAIKQDLPIMTSDVFLAIFFSMIFGLLAIRFMLNYLARHSLAPFVIYRIALGILILILM